VGGSTNPIDEGGSVYNIWTVKKWQFKFARFANAVAKRYLDKTHVEKNDPIIGFAEASRVRGEKGLVFRMEVRVPLIHFFRGIAF